MVGSESLAGREAPCKQVGARDITSKQPAVVLKNQLRRGCVCVRCWQNGGRYNFVGLYGGPFLLGAGKGSKWEDG